MVTSALGFPALSPRIECARDQSESSFSHANLGLGERTLRRSSRASPHLHARRPTPAVAARAPGPPQASGHLERPRTRPRTAPAVAMSSQQKRPAARRRPVPVAGAPRPAGAPAPGGSSSANPPPPRPAGGGLLSSIIGGIKREGAAVKAAVKDGRAVISSADVETREEKAMRARRDFEKTHGDRMRLELVEGESDDPELCIEFPPMNKVWRNILHELAGELHLHAESVELEDPTASGDKFVVVYRKPPVVELTEAEEARRLAAAQRARASSGVKRGEALTDQAPRFAEGDPGPELTVVGTVKRDLRGVAETIGDMRKRKREQKAGEGE